eukprot:3915540-Rhodomonas_salina.1
MDETSGKRKGGKEKGWVCYTDTDTQTHNARTQTDTDTDPMGHKQNQRHKHCDTDSVQTSLPPFPLDLYSFRSPSPARRLRSLLCRPPLSLFEASSTVAVAACKRNGRLNLLCALSVQPQGSLRRLDAAATTARQVLLKLGAARSFVPISMTKSSPSQSEFSSYLDTGTNRMGIQDCPEFSLSESPIALSLVTHMAISATPT